MDMEEENEDGIMRKGGKKQKGATVFFCSEFFLMLNYGFKRLNSLCVNYWHIRVAFCDGFSFKHIGCFLT